MAGFKENWINEQVKRIQMMHPDDDVMKIQEFVTKKFDENFTDPKAIVYNNYEKETVNTTLCSILNWINKTKPITMESGTLFKQHADAWNPDAAILESFLSERKVAKKKMFEYIEKTEAETDRELKAQYSSLVTRYNLMQKRKKVCANSEYGASGLPSSWFYNIACSSSTTARGQNLISCAETAFEDFLADNVKFLNMSECIRFIEVVCDEKETRTHKDSKWIKNQSVNTVVERLHDKFLFPNDADTILIEKIVKNLSQDDLNRIYYKSNLEGFFIDSEHAQDIISDIVMTDIEYLLPMKPPKQFEKKVIELKDAVLEYVHFCHPTMERVYRLRGLKRKRIITIDKQNCRV